MEPSGLRGAHFNSRASRRSVEAPYAFASGAWPDVCYVFVGIVCNEVDGKGARSLPITNRSYFDARVTDAGNVHRRDSLGAYPACTESASELELRRGLRSAVLRVLRADFGQLLVEQALDSRSPSGAQSTIWISLFGHMNAEAAGVSHVDMLPSVRGPTPSLEEVNAKFHSSRGVAAVPRQKPDVGRDNAPWLA